MTDARDDTNGGGRLAFAPERFRQCTAAENATIAAQPMPPLHPYNAVFPVVSNDELHDWAESIVHDRLHLPLTLDKQGRLLDGKCRWLACEIAGVVPRFQIYDGDEDECAALIISANVRRYHSSPAQKAISAALSAAASPGCYWEQRVLPEAREIVAADRTLANGVLHGIYTLPEAYRRLTEQRKEAERLAAEHRAVEDFRKAQPVLAMEVDEGKLTLEQAKASINAPALAEHANAIRGSIRRMAGDAIEIGRRLAECKELVGHGNLLPWLRREFAWSERTAQNFMNLHELSLKSATIADLDVPLSALYMLAAPSTPDAVRTDILQRAGDGETFSVADVRRLIGNPRDDHHAELRKLIATLPHELVEAVERSVRDLLAEHRPTDPSPPSAA